MSVMDDVIRDAPLYPSALLSSVLRHEFSLFSITYNNFDSYSLPRVLEQHCKCQERYRLISRFFSDLFRHHALGDLPPAALEPQNSLPISSSL